MADESSVDPVQDELVVAPASDMNVEDDDEAVGESATTTPTQDELPQLLSSLAPGVSASGLEAAASALRGLPIVSTSDPTLANENRLDEISDSELAQDEDLTDLALRPVEQRLSNVSSPNPDLDDEDEVSLSGLSSADESENRLLIRSDVEDGEIPAAQQKATAEAASSKNEATNKDLVNGHSKTDDKDSSDDSDATDKRRRRRRFRKRQSSGSSASRRSDNEGRPSSISLSPRQSMPSSSMMSKKQKELPRYDVRNVINRKRAAKQRGSRSRSRSNSRKRSNSRTRSRHNRRPRSRSPRNRRMSTRSPSRSPVVRNRRLSTRSRSRSRSSPLPARNRRIHRRKSRSRSPINRRTPRRRSRSRSPRRRSRSRSSPIPRRRNSRLRDRSLSPQVVQVNNNKSKKNSGNKNASSKVSKKKQRSRSRSRSKSRKTKKTTKKSSQKSTKKSKKSKKQQRQQSRDQDLGYFNNASGSSVANKEVFTSGDKIMVSVNFKNAANKSAAEIAATTKPSLVIDIMSSPYQVIEPSPEPIIDVLSEDEDISKKTKEIANKNNDLQEVIEDNDDSADIIEHIMESHKGPCTPPTAIHQSLDLAKGPQTPEEDSYDPCDPTESPELEDDDDDDNAGDEILLHSGSSSPSLQGSASNRDEQLLKTAASTIPFLMEDSLIQRLENNGAVTSTTNNDKSNNSDLNDHPVDMDMDSPFSPQSSECSDIFEPPTPNTPKAKRSKTNGNVTSSTKFHHSKHARKGGAANNNKHVQMRIVDDKLKIIDDVPTSAVEMAVKEKFLKKVQRQERIVEEIKTVLKPYYNRKRITKEDYKDILRKCVPKVCHSKKGDINPTKIQKLVKGYVRKYHHARKKSL